jgi:uncharacterized membrane protein YoaT (DUF817 family)
MGSKHPQHDYYYPVNYGYIPNTKAPDAEDIYINFFTHHYMYDARYVLIAWSVYLFRTTYIHWHTANANYRTHALLPGIAFGVLIWVAENLGTFGHAWIYPHQATAWTLVHPEKIISWYLLSMISFSLVLMIRSRTVDQHP